MSQTNTTQDKVLIPDEIDYLSFVKSQKDQAERAHIKVIKCNNCGSTSSIDDPNQPGECPHCGTPFVIGKVSEENIISPWGMVPFGIEPHKARELMQAALKKRWFKPDSFKVNSLLGTHFQAVYVPYWTYDCNMKLYYLGQRGDEVSDGDTLRLFWTPVHGEINYFFDDIMVSASGKASNEVIRGLAPWELQNLVPFKERLLNGVRVAKYEQTVEQGLKEAKDKIQEAIELFVYRDIGGDQQKIDNVNVRFDGITFKHVLMPVYMAGIQHNGKPYPLVVNGVTGKFNGKIPRSPGKIALFVAGLAAILAALVYGLNL